MRGLPVPIRGFLMSARIADALKCCALVGVGGALVGHRVLFVPARRGVMRMGRPLPRLRGVFARILDVLLGRRLMGGEFGASATKLLASTLRRSLALDEIRRVVAVVNHDHLTVVPSPLREKVSARSSMPAGGP